MVLINYNVTSQKLLFSSLPERDYEIKDGLTDIDIMMQDEFQELERDYPHARSPY